MTNRMVVGYALGCALFAAPAFAHHAPSSLGSFRITSPVQAGGTTLQPGAYEVRLTGEHVTPLPGQSDEATQRVEILSNGQVVARDSATVIAVSTPAVVGTSGSTNAIGVVQMLKGGEFLRVSFNKGSERFLIHLAVN